MLDHQVNLASWEADLQSSSSCFYLIIIFITPPPRDLRLMLFTWTFVKLLTVCPTMSCLYGRLELLESFGVGSSAILQIVFSVWASIIQILTSYLSYPECHRGEFLAPCFSLCIYINGMPQTSQFPVYISLLMMPSCVKVFPNSVTLNCCNRTYITYN